MGMRTMVKNRVHSKLAKRGIRLGVPRFTREGRTLLQSLGLEAVGQVLPVAGTLNGQMVQISASLKRMCGEYHQTRLFSTILGVGYYIALLIVSEIDDINRFPGSEKFCSYAALVPIVKWSGGSTYHGEITRKGSNWLLRLSPKRCMSTSSTIGT